MTSVGTGLEVGDPAPWFAQRTSARPDFVFDIVAGRYIVLCFFHSATDKIAAEALKCARQHAYLFDDSFASFFGVTADPADEGRAEVAEQVPGFRFFLDFDLKISRLYGVAPPAADALADLDPDRRCWVILDPSLRVKKIFPLRAYREAIGYLGALPSAYRHVGFEVPPPVLVVPDVFESSFCRHLIEQYEADGGTSSGVMRDINNRTVLVNDATFKVRKDYHVKDKELIAELQARIVRRIVPEIQKVHQFRVTRMERYLVACYSAEDGAHFRAHRDNTTKGTAHRRFAVSINLNDEFAGGEVSFPEYSDKGFKAPVGGAVVFSCSLLHAVSRVTSGRRYAFLPFVYDDAAARLRQDNKSYLDRAAP